MQKIDKTVILSTSYETWEKDLETNNKPHDKYNSSQHKFYYDIVMNLFHCQKGLCAYTEVLLCAENLYKEDKWKNGVYVKDWGKTTPYNGSLDHFDPDLKSKKGETGIKDWLWDNFFMAETDTNRRKSTQKVDVKFKPDNPNYSPELYLTYDKVLDKFNAKDDLSDDLKEQVKDMLKVLGINHPTIIRKRAQTLKSHFGYGCLHNEFPTAIRFYENEL